MIIVYVNVCVRAHVYFMYSNLYATAAQRKIKQKLRARVHLTRYGLISNLLYAVCDGAEEFHIFCGAAYLNLVCSSRLFFQVND